MKLGKLRSVGHNIADSLASGIGLMIGVYEMDIFAEATSSKAGYIRVDFLAGSALDGQVSPSTNRAIVLYKEALPGLCAKHGLGLQDFKVLQARFGVDPVYGRHFSVTVEDAVGKRSTDQYIGVPGKRSRRRRR